MAAPFLSQVNLVLQIVVLGLILSSYVLKRRSRFFLHGSIMLIAVVLNAVSFSLVMGPSLYSLRFDLFANLSSDASFVVLIHVVLGSVAEIFGVWIVGSWRLRSGVKYCADKKNVMRVTLPLWTLALLLGVYLYALLYP